MHTQLQPAHPGWTRIDIDVDKHIAQAHRMRAEHTARLIQAGLSRLRKLMSHRGNGTVATP
jgi:hypothetical protein